jgi:hypothetical protein
MESDVTPEQALQDAEQATATLWTDYPPTPSWYYPAGGAWSAGFVLALGGLNDQPLLQLVAMAALFALLVWFANWYTRYRGAIPRVGSAPAEFRPAITILIAGVAVLIGAIALLYVAVGYVAAAALALVGVTAALYTYERAYEAAAAATRERLG